MVSQELQFVGNRANAPRLPSGAWETHKARIIELYREEKRTLKEVMKIMQEEYGFEPSHRQYTHQFNKWGLQKNTTAGRGEAVVSGNPQYMVQTGSAALRRSRAKTNLSDLGPRGQLNREHKPVGDDLERKFVHRFHKNEINEWILGQGMQSALCRALGRRLDPLGHSQQTLTAESFPHTVLWMKYAADLRFSLGVRYDAYLRYLDLYGLFREADAPAWITGWAKAMCIRGTEASSMYPELLNLVLESNNDPESDSWSFEEVIHYAHLGDIPTSEYQGFGDHDRNPKDPSDPNHVTQFRFPLPEEFRLLDLSLYLHLEHKYGQARAKSIPVHPPIKDSERIQTELRQRLFQCRPGPFEIMDGSMANRSIISCLSWCEATLYSELATRGFLKLTYKTPDPHQTFLVLWTMFEESLSSPPIPSRTQQEDPDYWWCLIPEKLLGMSAPEILSIVSRMVSDSWRDMGDINGVTSSVEGAALKGVRVLRRLTAVQLANKFVDACISMEEAAACRYRDASAKEVEKTMTSTLERIKSKARCPDPRALLPRESTSGAAEEIPNPLVPDLPTLTSSSQCSEMLYARSIGQNLQLESLGGESEPVKPSAMMASQESGFTYSGNSFKQLRQSMVCRSFGEASLVSLSQLSDLLSEPVATSTENS